MSRDRWITAGLAVLLLAAGAASWTLQLRSPLEVDTEVLARLPIELGTWKGRDVPMESGIVDMLAADYNLQRVYMHPLGEFVWLYVGYYSTQRGGRPEHTPWVCYPSNGWEILEKREISVDPEADRWVNELVVEKEGSQRLVHFWYQSAQRSGMLGGFDQALDRIQGRLSSGRADGSLVRLSTPLEGSSLSAARTRLIRFGEQVHPELLQHWPVEVVAERS